MPKKHYYGYRYHAMGTPGRMRWWDSRDPPDVWLLLSNAEFIRQRTEKLVLGFKVVNLDNEDDEAHIKRGA